MTSNKIDYIELIPEYLNGLLSREEETQFEIAISKDPDLNRELEEFRELQDLYKETIPEKKAEPSELIFTRIINEINEREENTEKGYRTPTYSPGTLLQINEFLSRLKDSVSIPWGLAFVQAAIIVILLIPRIPESSYKTLGITSGSEADIISLNIVFKESTREADIRELLLPINGSIISGPSAQGRYLVSIPSDSIETQIVSRLKKSEHILFVEKSY